MSEKVADMRRSQSRTRGAQVFRLALAIVVCLTIVAGISVVSLYFLLQGKSGENSVIISQIETRIEEALGGDVDVVMQQVDLDLSQLGKTGFVSNDVIVKRHADNAVLATLREVRANASFANLLRGKLELKSVAIDGAIFDAGSVFGNTPGLMPAHLDKPLRAFGSAITQLEKGLGQHGFDSLEITNSRIEGPVLGRRSVDPLEIVTLQMTRGDDGNLYLNGELTTELSNVSLRSSFGADDNGRAYKFSADGISLREWSNEPADEAGVIALDSIVTVSGELPFNAQDRLLNPKLQISAQPGNMRVGIKARTEIESAELNFKIFLDRNQIELDSSPVRIGRFNGSIIGGLKPEVADVGYAGPFLYDFIIERGEFAPTLENEPVIPGAFQVTGLFDRDRKRVGVKQIIVSTPSGGAIGKGSIDLSGETPGIKGSMTSDGISVLAVKQFWPYFVADKARGWIHDHIIDGRVTSGTVEVDIPPGILFRLKDGKKLAPEHYKTVLNLADFSFRPFGDMPAIYDAKGTVTLEGMKIAAELEKGSAADLEGNEIRITKGSFEMPDFAAKERIGNTTLELDGNITTIARISDRAPLRVMERMKVVPDQFSGKGYANIVARFPVGNKIQYENVDWNVLLELRDGASSKPLSGRRFSNADLLIDANPKGAQVRGSATLDGVRARVELAEPIGKSGAVKRSRKIVATFTEADREKLGFDLAPVVRGPIDITIRRDGKREFHDLDFTNSEVALPWIGWRKGKGIPSKGSFELSRKGEVFTLKDFKLSGSGFEGAGELVLNRKGLLKADISKLKLNEGDDIRLRLERKGDVYNINAIGLSIDARGILNTLIHAGGFTKAQGGRSVNLVANFDVVRGFNNRIIKNAILLYESKNGRLNRIDMSANGSDGRNYSVQAQLNGNDTLFTVNTNDAGTALAFSDIYTRMRGGTLNANLLQTESGPYLGPVRLQNFEVVNEPRLARMASNVNQMPNERGGVQRIIPDAEDKVIKFQLADAKIERGQGFMNVQDAIIRSGTMGITMTGKLYDQRDRMNLTGTFMPANGVNIAMSAIPLLGQLFSNGRDNALIGITYKLSGSRKNPDLEVNPLSIITPGVFNKVFEFK